MCRIVRSRRRYHRTKLDIPSTTYGGPPPLDKGRQGARANPRSIPYGTAIVQLFIVYNTNRGDRIISPPLTRGGVGKADGVCRRQTHKHESPSDSCCEEDNYLRAMIFPTRAESHIRAIFTIRLRFAQTQ